MTFPMKEERTIQRTDLSARYDEAIAELDDAIIMCQRVKQKLIQIRRGW